MARRVPSLAIILYMLLEKKKRQKSTVHLVRQRCVTAFSPSLSGKWRPGNQVDNKDAYLR